jgi:2EXR family
MVDRGRPPTRRGCHPATSPNLDAMPNISALRLTSRERASLQSSSRAGTNPPSIAPAPRSDRNGSTNSTNTAPRQSNIPIPPSTTRGSSGVTAPIPTPNLGPRMTANQMPTGSNNASGRTAVVSLLPRAVQASQRVRQQAAAQSTPNKAIRHAMVRRGQASSQRQARRRALEPRPVIATTFHGFPKLPKELQLKIWKYLIPGPRIIELKSVIVTEYLDDDDDSEITYDRCIAMTPHPLFLHICQDSRFLARKIYQRNFEDELKWPVYMDPSRDVLLLYDSLSLGTFASACQRTDTSTPPSLAKIKYILLDPKGVYTPLTNRPRREPEQNYPAYRHEEIAATYGSIPELVVLKAPPIDPLLPAPLNIPGLNNPNADTRGVEGHLRMLLRLSVTMSIRKAQNQMPNMVQGHGNLQGVGMNPLVQGTGVVVNNISAANFVGSQTINGFTNSLFAAGLYPGGPWGNGTGNPLNALITGRTPDAPWKIPKVRAMTLEEVKERMGSGEVEEEVKGEEQ